MQEIKWVNEDYKVLEHKVQYKVPATSTDVNLLDPKQPDAARTLAVDHIVQHNMNTKTRDQCLHGREAVEAKDGKPAVSKIIGVEDEANSWGLDVASLGLQQKDGRLVKTGGEAVTNFDRFTEPALDKSGKQKVKEGEPVFTTIESEKTYYDRVLSMAVALKKFASEDSARAHFQPVIVQIAADVVFDVTESEPSAKGPKRLPSKYKLAAAKAITLNKVDAINSNQLSKISKSFTATGDSTKMFTGTYDQDGQAVSFNVSDKDAEALGWLLKEYFDWKSTNELSAI